MPLPKISTPTYELDLPSTGKTIKYRPFLVKEEKVLILALESQDPKQITLAIKSVLKDCILTKGIKIEELPSFDIEYIFLNVRGKSVGEAIDLVVTCSDDGETEVPVKIFVDEIKVEKNSEHTTEIQVDDKIIVKMKYPSLEQFIKINLQLSFNAFVPSHAITMNKSKAAIILKVHNVILGFNYFYFQYLPSANTFTNTVSSSNASISCHSLALRFIGCVYLSITFSIPSLRITQLPE